MSPFSMLIAANSTSAIQLLVFVSHYALRLVWRS